MPEIDDVIFDEDAFWLEDEERKPEYPCDDCPASLFCLTDSTKLYAPRCPTCGEVHWITIGLDGKNVGVEEFRQAWECPGFKHYTNDSARCESCEWSDKMSKDD
jgi:hypothetical protein